MSKALFIKTLHGLMCDPSDERSREVLKGVALGATVQVDVTRPRNIQMHRLYWAMVGKIADAVDLPSEAVSDHLKCETGHCHVMKTKNGVRRYPKSISFAAMEQPEFRDFFERCCRVISMEWLPHMNAKQVQTEVLEMMGITWERAA